MEGVGWCFEWGEVTNNFNYFGTVKAESKDEVKFVDDGDNGWDSEFEFVDVNDNVV